MVRRVDVGVLCLALATGGCDPHGIETDEGQLTVRLSELHAPGHAGLSRQSPILQGSRTTSAWGPAGLLADDDNELEGCFTIATEPDIGPLGGALSFDEVGPVEWTFEVSPCDHERDGELVDDRLELEVVSPEGLAVSRHFRWVATAGELLAHDAGDETWELADGRTALPEFLSPARGPLRVLEGGRTELGAAVMTPDGRYVAVGEGVGGLELADLPAEPRGPLALVIEGPAAPGSTYGLAFRSPGLDTELGPVEIVAADAIDHLQVLVLDRIHADGTRGSFAALAVPVDRDGNRLFGGRVEWTLLRGASLPLADPEAAIDDGPLMVTPEECLPPSGRVGTHSSVVRAALGPHQASVELSWTLGGGDPTADASAEADEDWERPPECVSPARACGCNDAPGSAPGIALLAWLATRWRRRGRLDRR